LSVKVQLLVLTVRELTTVICGLFQLCI